MIAAAGFLVFIGLGAGVALLFVGSEGDKSSTSVAAPLPTGTQSTPAPIVTTSEPADTAPELVPETEPIGQAWRIGLIKVTSGVEIGQSRFTQAGWVSRNIVYYAENMSNGTVSTEDILPLRHFLWDSGSLIEPCVPAQSECPISLVTNQGFEYPCDSPAPLGPYPTVSLLPGMRVKHELLCAMPANSRAPHLKVAGEGTHELDEIEPDASLPFRERPALRSLPASFEFDGGVKLVFRRTGRDKNPVTGCAGGLRELAIDVQVMNRSGANLHVGSVLSSSFGGPRLYLIDATGTPALFSTYSFSERGTGSGEVPPGRSRGTLVTCVATIDEVYLVDVETGLTYDLSAARGSGP